MKLKANFVGDWIEMLKEILSDQGGYDISGVDDKEIPFLYFNAAQRRIEQRKRTVELSDVFQCPQELVAGWQNLKAKVESGRDITPNLSKKVANLYEKDPLLNDWGVHHFHLVENPNRNNKILFALVTKDRFYAINVHTHEDWAKDVVVETIHRNWPEVIAPFKIKVADLAQNISERNRKVLRKKNINACVKVSDGTIYLPIGGGVSGAGFNSSFVIQIDRQKAFLENLQKGLYSQLNNIREDLIKRGYKGEPEVEAKLIITENEYKAFFPVYKLTVKFKLTA